MIDDLNHCHESQDLPQNTQVGGAAAPPAPPAGALPAEWQHYIGEGSNADDT